MTFRFICTSCEEVHEGIPTFGADAPALYYRIANEERAKRVLLDTDTCTIDNERFLIRGCLEIPVDNESDPFIWGVWVDVSQRDFKAFLEVLEVKHRKQVGPFAGYLGSELPGYPESTFNLHVVAYLRDDGIRPLVTVAPSAHPLHKEQCQGMSAARLSEIYETVMHGE
jgi:hypothetical protein